MDRKKIIYIGSILLVTVFVSVTYFSYAFFTSKNEYHGRVNMVAGTLDYQINCEDLDSNNTINIGANTEKKLEIEIESLNTIDSKYELYYETSNNSIEVGYSTLKDNATGTIGKDGKKKVVVRLSNPSNTASNVTFKVEGGFTYNNLVLSSGNSISELDPITVTYDRGNLIYGLVNTGEVKTEYVKYSISDEIVTVTALRDDGFGFTRGRIYLEAGKTYIFNCEIDGIWGGDKTVNNERFDNVEAYINLDGQWSYYIHFDSNNNYEFTPSTTGEYWLRLDVNKDGETHQFWNISITEKNPTTKQVVYGEEYGTLPTEQERPGYVFKGWNGKNLLNYNELTDVARNYGIQVDSEGYVSDSTPNTDARVWGYAASNFKLDLSPDNYRVSIIFKNMTSNLNNGITVFDNKNNFLFGNGYNVFTNKAFHSIPFSISENLNIGILIKGYEGIYRVQLERGSILTDWEPYYLTSSTVVTQAQNHTLTAIFEKKEATFLAGEEFNVKIKKLAGDEDPTYDTVNTSITSIQGANNLSFTPTSENIVSTDNSKYPIYAWYNNGTIYYYTEALNPSLSNGYSMFNKLTKVTSIDIKTIDTSETTNFYAMFHLNSSLEKIDLSNFDSKNVNSMAYMLAGCSKLTNIIFGKKFDTSNVANMSWMFVNDVSIKKLDLSNFDMSRVNNVSNMLGSMTELEELKTPKVYPTDSSLKITLPKTMYDASGNAYTELDNTSPTETILTSTQP